MESLAVQVFADWVFQALHGLGAGELESTARSIKTGVMCLRIIERT